MDATKIHEFARQLMDANGATALATAAQKAAEFEAKGDHDNARTWRRVESAMREMHGPHTS